MQAVIDAIGELFLKWNKKKPRRIELLPQAGSDRRYFRIHTDSRTWIATHGNNVPENEAFIYFSNHFRERNLPVPEILAVSEDKTIYLQEDLGDISLLNRLEAEGFTPAIYDLFRYSLHQIATLQVKGHEGLD